MVLRILLLISVSCFLPVWHVFFHTSVEDGTQGLHFCQLEPYADTPVLDPAAVETLGELQTEAISLIGCVYAQTEHMLVEMYLMTPHILSPLLQTLYE
jgi:hypothetical protein